MRSAIPLIISLVWLNLIGLFAGVVAAFLCAVSMLAVALLALWEAGKDPRA